jgi:acyl-coenzyme A thioesterase PaaI-like protein
VSGIPGERVGPMMSTLVPMVGTLGLEFVEVSAERAVVRLRDQPEYRNHVGGPHAAVMFAVAETATGAIALAAFGDLLQEAAPVPMSTSYDFLAVAIGDLTATAVVEADLDEARRLYVSGTRPEFDIVADVCDASGTVTGRFRSRWTLKRLG